MKKLNPILICVIIMLFSCSEDLVETELIQPPEDIESSLKASQTITYYSQYSFVSSLSSYGYKEPDDINFNRTGSTSGYSSVYGFNIPSNLRAGGFKWNSGDTQSTGWYPQGITGFKWNGRRYLLVAWYNKNSYRGSRVSLVDITNMKNIKYRHILLVQPRTSQTSTKYTQLGTFRPVPIHAGGLAYSKGKLYVASTSLGIRVFDLKKIIEVTTANAGGKCGKGSDGKIYAFTYRYVLPQSGYYKMSSGNPFSCVSFSYGSSSSDIRVVTGQYLAEGSPKMYSYKLNPNGSIKTNLQPEIISPIDKYGGPIYRVQGVFTKDNKKYLIHTGNSWYEGSTARLSRYQSGKKTVRYRWPHGAEDLYYESSTGLLWNCTEYPTSKYNKDNRCVFAVKLSNYD